MVPGETGERRAGLRGQLIDRLHDPLQLRMIVIGLIVGVGYLAVYTPLEERISQTLEKINHERKLGELAIKIEQLEGQCGKFVKLLPQQSDKKEWLQYILEGARRFPVTLTNVDVTASKQVGPYQAAVLRIEATGSYYDLDQLLRWFEANPRLLRVDTIDIGLVKGGDKPDKDLLVMQLTVLGLGG